MPVLTIYYDESLDDAVRAHCAAIQEGLEAVMRDVLVADPAKCQVVLVVARHASPKRVHVALQYRAKPHRTRAVVAEAMNQVASVLHGALGCGLHIRAFDIDQSFLHALDTDGPG
ncbi:MAG: hypothetical protein AAF563_17480 [Pseudomonadota bacterium]